jgi:hypothetical protein
MVEIIGLATVVAMSWLLAFAMANESDAEKRRCALPGALLRGTGGDLCFALLSRYRSA